LRPGVALAHFGSTTFGFAQHAVSMKENRLQCKALIELRTGAFCIHILTLRVLHLPAWLSDGRPKACCLDLHQLSRQERSSTDSFVASCDDDQLKPKEIK